MTPAAVLEARDIVAGYLPGVDILRGCSLELGEGEIVGIVGPNGAGKSTLVKAIVGLVAIRSGSVRLAGEEVTGLPAHEMVARGLGYVPQRDNVFPSLTVEDNLRMGMYVRGGDFEPQFDRVVTLFPRLAERRGQRAGYLSGGERQMVAMARALMVSPMVLVLDEPSAGLSPTFQDQVFDRILEVNRAGVSIVMVEQNARRCLQISHRGYVLDAGTNAHTGGGRELLEDPKVVDLYLGTLAREG